MVREICRMGNPILREEAREIFKEEIKSDWFCRLLQDLYDSMKDYGGIGIAAPQIGVSVQVAIIELSEINRYGENVQLPLTTFINPTLKHLTSENQGFWEGCLSVPGLRGYVERPKKIQVNYMDEKANMCELIAEGFLATVLQHELDHLHGKLYIDRIKDFRLLTYQEEFEQFFQATESLD